MSEIDKVFAGSIPALYDRYMVPLIFAEYASDLARRASSFSPGDVLETAAGSGVVTRALAPLLDVGARYVVTDLNQPMLDHAASVQANSERITWQQADALDLPFEDNSFDVVLCQFGVMFFPDRTAGYREARRVLRPGGRFVFNSWDRIGENDFADIVTQTAAEAFPNDPPLFLARTPHGYHDVDMIRQDVEAAGFSGVSVETVTKTSTAQTAHAPAVAFCQGTPLRNEIESRDADRLEQITEQAARAIAARFGAGPVTSKIQALVVTATA